MPTGMFALSRTRLTFHAADGNTAGGPNHSHDMTGSISDVTSHSHMAGTTAKDADVLTHEHDAAGDPIRSDDTDLTNHDHVAEGLPDPADEQAHTHDMGDGTVVASVMRHTHDTYGVKVDHSHAADAGPPYA